MKTIYTRRRRRCRGSCRCHHFLIIFSYLYNKKQRASDDEKIFLCGEAKEKKKKKFVAHRSRFMSDDALFLFLTTYEYYLL